MVSLILLIPSEIYRLCRPAGPDPAMIPGMAESLSADLVGRHVQKQRSRRRAGARSVVARHRIAGRPAGLWFWLANASKMDPWGAWWKKIEMESVAS